MISTMPQFAQMSGSTTPCRNRLVDIPQSDNHASGDGGVIVIDVAIVVHINEVITVIGVTGQLL